jgi:hypothetical protein
MRNRIETPCGKRCDFDGRNRKHRQEKHQGGWRDKLAVM